MTGALGPLVRGLLHAPAVRAAFLLVNDLALILMRNQIATVNGVDPLTPEGISRWAEEATTVYTQGAFQAPAPHRQEGDDG